MMISVEAKMSIATGSVALICIFKTCFYFYFEFDNLMYSLYYLLRFCLSTWARKWQPMEDVKGMWCIE